MVKRDQIKDLNPEELFELKNKFLRDIPHPKLIFKAIKTIQPSAILPTYENSQVKADLFEHIEHYSSVLLDIKLRISQSKTSEELLPILNALLTEQMRLIWKLSQYILTDSFFGFDEIKQSGPIDYYLIKKSRALFPEADNKIKEYLCSELNAHENGSELNSLLVPFFRAKKIVQNG